MVRRLRIFIVIERSTNASVPGGSAWYRNLYEPLSELGHQAYLYPAEEGRLAMQKHDSDRRSLFSEKLLGTFRREQEKQPFDLFFSYLKEGMVDSQIIDAIRGSGVPTCNFSCNNTHQFHLVRSLSPHFDYNLHSEKDAAAEFRAIGANAVWFPMAANPNYYRPRAVARCLDVSFVGQCYARRPYYIEHLLDNGVNIQVYGPNWVLKQDKMVLRKAARSGRRTISLFRAFIASSAGERYRFSSAVADIDFRERLRRKYPANLHGPIEDDDMIQKFSESKISLGFLEVHDAHDPAAMVKQHLHLREFEGPMSGALYFTGWCEELGEFYEPDKEVVIYRSEHELLDKSRYYLGHPDQAEQVRQAGRRRALADHTYHKRFKELFAHLGLC